MKVPLVVKAGAIVLALVALAYGGPFPGAVFTTLPDGTRVNANIYTNAYDVYLDGGPGPNAPPGAAGLPEGNYYFQVTDPSGKRLLSTDPVNCRTFHVNEYGVIDSVIPVIMTVKIRGKLTDVDMTHVTGIDVDHEELGAITVQLMPFSETPNKGGVYKVWVTPIDKFVGDPTLVDNGYSPPNYHGFLPGWSKTDNFKVHVDSNGGKPPQKQWVHTLFVRKFFDLNANGAWEKATEPEIIGWPVDVIDPYLVVNSFYTPASYFLFNEAVPYTVTVVEGSVEDWWQTALMINGVSQPLAAEAYVDFTEEGNQTNTVVFGNVTFGDVTLFKFYDRDLDGVWDAGEPPLEGVMFTLTGVDVIGNPVSLSGTTTTNGSLMFVDLVPGNYTLTEILPAGEWIATTPTNVSFFVPGGDGPVFEFGNACKGYAGFGTKGYWHNKNGLSETSLEDLAFLNGLLPWQAPSTYFDNGDEPIDGFFEDGTPVPGAKGDWGEEIAPPGTAWAEQSLFLVDANASGDPREQLAQQLDAFVMNMLHRLGGDTMVELPGGGWAAASALIDNAVTAWASGTDEERNQTASLLDTLNNSSAVGYISLDPCPIVYP
jgi:hypothetical protein